MICTCVRCGKQFEVKRKTSVCKDCHTEVCVVCGKDLNYSGHILLKLVLLNVEESMLNLQVQGGGAKRDQETLKKDMVLQN